ncbi:MAG TPA: carbonic anhydrase family protein [Candidatus Acidoferrales bacterium]|nr:carbonic anhydrase family protein [Candidatus Acidoferrales bacterium]
MTFAFLAGAAILVPVAPRAQWRTPWSYNRGAADGPQHWAHLDPEYAACDGKEQSPIDIRSAVPADLPPLRFEDKSGPINIINNGYTAVRLDYAPGNGNFLVVGDQRYELVQFHFHHPSEEYVHGRPSDMVIHLMYQSSDGKNAGVAVLLNEGSANPVVSELWKYMAKTKGPARVIPGAEVNPDGLLPRETGYYMYMGSISAPPCTEGVKWFVMKSRVQVSTAQIAAFAKLYPHDVRPLQPLDGRTVEETK